MNAATSFTPEQTAQLNARFDAAHPLEIVKWASETFGPDLVMTSSFGADSMCTIHLATQVKPDIRIIFIDTGFLFPETYAFMHEMRDRFHLNVLEFRTRNEPLTWLSVNGEPDPRFRTNRQACCGANKDEPTDRAFAELRPLGYLRGIRASQTQERSKASIVQWFARYNAWAVSPILRWSSRDVFAYMKQHDLPHHPLWEKGYVSLGCSPESCTRPITAGEDERAGRWSGSDKKECGINLDA